MPVLLQRFLRCIDRLLYSMLSILVSSLLIRSPYSSLLNKINSFDISAPLCYFVVGWLPNMITGQEIGACLLPYSIIFLITIFSLQWQAYRLFQPTIHNNKCLPFLYYEILDNNHFPI